jgi:DNA-binding CsgD family transcriptional regulator
MKRKSDNRPKEAAILYAVKNGAIHIAQICDITKISRFMVQRHLKRLEMRGQIKMQVEKGMAGISERDLNHYYFIHDNDDLIGNFLNLPKEANISATPFLQKMFGFTEHKNITGGRKYDERSIKKIMQEKNITVWNPFNRKSPKNFVKGGTLLNI